METSAPPSNIHPIGFVRSSLTDRSTAPRQGAEGGVDAWVEILPAMIQGVDGLSPGDELWLLTWFHQAERDVLAVRPRRDPQRRPTGVFATRSPDRPNPIGLHRVKLLAIESPRLRVGPLEAIEGTPVIDIKPVLGGES